MCSSKKAVIFSLSVVLLVSHVLAPVGGVPVWSTSTSARWVMRRLGAAPVPVVLAGLEEDAVGPV
jgi:hypothetical protein